MLGMMLLTIAVWLYMFAKRIPYIQTKQAEGQEPTAEMLAAAPSSITSPSDNLKNLFEVPILFYAAVLFLYVTQQVDALYLYAAWGFFLFRALHSILHCTINIIMARFVLYLIASLCLFFMIIRAAIAHFVG